CYFLLSVLFSVSSFFVSSFIVSFFLFFFTFRRLPISTLFPYTTLFRSLHRVVARVQPRCHGADDRAVHEGDVLRAVLDRGAEGDGPRIRGRVDDRQHDAAALGVPRLHGGDADVVVPAVGDVQGGGRAGAGFGHPLRVGRLPRRQQELLHRPGQQGGGRHRFVAVLAGAVGGRHLLAGQGRVLLGGETVQQRGAGHRHLGEGVAQGLGALEALHQPAGDD